MMVLGTLLACSRCSDANGPADVDTLATNPPIGASTSGRIAFVTERLSGGGFVYVANADGSGLRQLPGDQAHYMRPRWSPDGRRIAVARLELGSPTTSIFVIDVDGQSKMTRLTFGTDPAWSPGSCLSPEPSALATYTKPPPDKRSVTKAILPDVLLLIGGGFVASVSTSAGPFASLHREQASNVPRTII